MILIADGGSTKCDWALLKKDNVKTYSTQGFNPMYHSKQVVVEGIKANPNFVAQAPYVNQVYFYGAGCHNAELKKIIEKALKEVFNNAEIYVDHDLTAAIRATAGSQKGISCILGTGSNLAYFDGLNTHTIVSGLGYILGDEGSGTYFGKKLLADYLYNNLPESMASELRNIYKLDKNLIIKNIYMKPHANVYLAQFMRMISTHSKENYVQELVFQGLSRFIDVHVKRFNVYQSVPVHFVGSIGYYFKESLEQVCQAQSITLGKVIKRPIESLVNYHQQLVTNE